eukprot:ANDGO_08492.mRNA.1 WD repeat-containing protein tag-125
MSDSIPTIPTSEVDDLIAQAFPDGTSPLISASSRDAGQHNTSLMKTRSLVAAFSEHRDESENDGSLFPVQRSTVHFAADADEGEEGGDPVPSETPSSVVQPYEDGGSSSSRGAHHGQVSTPQFDEEGPVVVRDYEADRVAVKRIVDSEKNDSVSRYGNTRDSLVDIPRTNSSLIAADSSVIHHPELVASTNHEQAPETSHGVATSSDGNDNAHGAGVSASTDGTKKKKKVIRKVVKKTRKSADEGSVASSVASAPSVPGNAGSSQPEPQVSQNMSVVDDEDEEDGSDAPQVIRPDQQSNADRKNDISNDNDQNSAGISGISASQNNPGGSGAGANRRQEDRSAQSRSNEPMLDTESKKEQLQSLFGRPVSAKEFDHTILQVTVKRSDALRADSFAFHPVVRVSVVDLETGKLLLKPDASAPVSTAREYSVGRNSHEISHLSTVLPVLTKPCNLQETKTTVCEWNEKIIFNLDYMYCLRPNVCIFFEILDFGSDQPLGRRISSADGLSRIAWGFLKLVHADGRANTQHDHIILQLYEYNVLAKKTGLSRLVRSCIPQTGTEYELTDQVPYASVLSELVRIKRKTKYPALLYVGVRGIPEVTAPIRVHNRAMYSFEQEVGNMDYEELRKSTILSRKQYGALQAEAETGASGVRFQNLDAAFRRRRPQDLCMVPDSLLFQFDAGDRGASVLKISDNGRVLAAACWGRFYHTLKLYDLIQGRLIASVDAHRKLVHDLAFSCVDTELISASSDGTVAIWSVAAFTHAGESCNANVQAITGPSKSGNVAGVQQGEKKSESSDPQETTSVSSDGLASFAEPLMRFAHPCFAYCARMHPTCENPRLLFTGGYDHQIRVFNRDTGTLMRVISGHHSFVNSLVFDAQGTRMYTADGDGVIKIWSARVRSSAKAAAASGRAIPAIDLEEGIVCLRTIAEKEMIGRSITSIRMSSNGKRLLVSSRDNILRSFAVDLASTVISHRYMGVVTENYPVRGEFSPDGSYVICGSETGRLYLWDTNSGDILNEVGSKGIDVGYSAPLCAVAWSPTHHVVAISSFGSMSGEPIRVLCFEYDDPVNDDDDSSSMGDAGNMPTDAGFNVGLSTAVPLYSSSTFASSLGSHPGGSSTANLFMGLSSSSMQNMLVQYGMNAMPGLMELVRARKRVGIIADKDYTNVSHDVARERAEQILKDVARMRASQQQAPSVQSSSLSPLDMNSSPSTDYSHPVLSETPSFAVASSAESRARRSNVRFVEEQGSGSGSSSGSTALPPLRASAAQRQ